MKRRVVSKTSSSGARTCRLGSSLHRGSSSQTSGNVRCPTKKLTRQRGSQSAAASILGLKRSPSTSNDSTRWSSDESNAVNHVAECKWLREQLERVLVDHQRQEEEIVALRALAKSLTEEVEAIQERQQLQSSAQSSDNTLRGSRAGSHEFFRLDVQVEKLGSENAELRRQLEDPQENYKLVRACMAEKLPVYKLAAVKANAELRCVKSQLQQERAHSDLLQKQLVRCKARQDDVPVRVSPERCNNQEEEDHNPRENEIFRREREAFLRQCMRFRDSKARISPKSSELETDMSAPQEDHTVLVPSMEPETRKKSEKLIHDDLLGLDFYLEELILSPKLTPTS